MEVNSKKKIRTMPYNGFNVDEMKPERWDGRAKEMLVMDCWFFNNQTAEEALKKRTVIGYDSINKMWVAISSSSKTDNPTYEHYNFCYNLPPQLVKGKEYRCTFAQLPDKQINAVWDGEYFVTTETPPAVTYDTGTQKYYPVHYEYDVLIKKYSPARFDIISELY